MKKGLIIGCVIVLAVGLSAFVFANKKSNAQQKELGNDMSVSLLSVTSQKYAELMGVDEKDAQEYDDFLFYIMRIENKEGKQSPVMAELTSKEEFGARVNYLSNEISKDLFIIQGIDTLSCSIAHWERTYNLRKDVTLNLMFKKKNNDRPTKFIWEDKLITGIPVKIKLNR